MINRLKMVLLLVAISIVLAACGIGLNPGSNKDLGKESNTKKSGTNENQVWIQSINLTVASKNDNHIYCVNFPYHFFYLDSEAKKISLYDFPEKPNKYISREDFDLFNNFVKEHSGDKKPVNADYAYSIFLSYYDEEGERQSKYCEGYNEFPEELNPLIDKFNELCGGIYFSHPGKVQKLTPEFIYDEFKLSKADYPIEAVNGMINDSYLSFKQFVGKTGTIDNYMKGYEHSLESKKIEDLMPTELLPEKEVSDEAFEDFTRTFIDRIGRNWKIADSSDQTELTRLVNADTNQTMYIGKSKALSSYEVRFWGDSATIDLDAHMEGMTMSTDFMYDESGAYILVDFMNCEDFSEIAKTFYYLNQTIVNQ